MMDAIKMNPEKTSPPVKEIIGSGIFPDPEPRVFKPVKAYQFKLYTYVFLVFVIITLVIGSIGTIIVLFADDPSPLEFAESLGMTENDFYWFLVLAYCLVSAFWIVPCLILIPIYLKSFKYVVHGTEVVVHKGLINKSEKHVPFRTITHISSRAGILDRLFGIGTVEIQTAGVSGGTSARPEEKIEGIRVYSEVRDFILRQLRNLKTQQLPFFTDYSKAARVKSKKAIDDHVLAEMLALLREIKDNLGKE
ncbi:MAG: PH domain-containing protein [Candidatus Odinarchaeota archaeon]